MIVMLLLFICVWFIVCKLIVRGFVMVVVFDGIVLGIGNNKVLLMIKYLE